MDKIYYYYLRKYWIISIPVVVVAIWSIVEPESYNELKGPAWLCFIPLAVLGLAVWVKNNDWLR